MSKRWNRPETWIGLIVLGIAAVLTAIGGIWVYVSATATPIHPSADGVPSVSDTGPDLDWTEAAERARQAMRAGLSEHNLPGLSVAVGINNEIVWAEAFGFANIDTREPVTPRTRFRIGTVSMPITAAAVGLLLENQRLNLDDEIQVHVPEYPKKPWPVTIRQLLAHVAGMPNDSGDEGPLFSQQCGRALDALPAFAAADLRFQPGSQYQYTRYGFILLSAAVEAAADDHLLRFLQQRVFDPLGMHDTMADSEDNEDRAMAYFPRFASDPRYGPDPMRPLEYSCYSGASVFVSTPSDLVRFGMAVNGGTLLQPATVQMMQTSQRLPDGTETGYGLGWDLETVTLNGQPAQVVGHDGDSLGGLIASLMIFKDRGMVVAVISNTSYADTPALALQVAEAFAAHAVNTPRRK